MADGLLGRTKYSDGQDVLCSYQVSNIYHGTVHKVEKLIYRIEDY